MTSFHFQFYICYAYKKKPQFSLEYYSNINLLQKKFICNFTIKKIVQTRSIKKKTSSPILEHFIQINYAPLTPPTRPYLPKTNNHLSFPLVRIKQSMVTEFPQITTPFPWRRVSTDSKNFLASAPRRWKLSRHRWSQKTR